MTEERKAAIDKFKKELANFRFHQSMCFECKMAAQHNADSPHGEDKLCTWHVCESEKLGFTETFPYTWG